MSNNPTRMLNRQTSAIIIILLLVLTCLYFNLYSKTESVNDWIKVRSGIDLKQVLYHKSKTEIENIKIAYNNIKIEYNKFKTESKKRINPFRHFKSDERRFNATAYTIWYRNTSNETDYKHYAPINAENITFLEDSATCQNDGENLKLLIGIKSSVSDAAIRLAIRETWAQNVTILNVSVFFIVGNSQNENVMKKLEIEKKQYQDIIHGDFKDDYFNLTIKSMLFYKFVVHHCSLVPTVVKLDDDVLLNMTLLIDHLEFIYFNSIAGNTVYGPDVKPIRKIKNKWYVPESVYPFDKYPTSFPGNILILDIEAVKLIYNASITIPYFFIDDIYETGMLTSITGTRLLDALFLIHYGPQHNMCKIVAALQIARSQFRTEWNKIKTESLKCP